MVIVQKSVSIIDYDSQSVIQRDPPKEFETFVSELINHVSTNKATREYKTRSSATQVINSALALCADPSNVELANIKMNGIANRLLLKEENAQEMVARLNVNVQKGSLIQALLFDNDSNGYYFLLAKVEHSGWVDDTDFSFKTGFSSDKKTIWKSCIVDLRDMEATEYNAKIYSPNKVAKYWYDDFLELDEMNNDETNTSRAFKAIETTLGKNFKVRGPDHTIIRNHFVGYLKNNEHIDYPTMVNTVLENYVPFDPDIQSEKIQEIRSKLLEQPQKRNFDNQFNSVNKAINARIKKFYPVNDGIELKVSSSIENMRETIRSVEERGIKYIKVRTNNETTFNQFLFEECSPDK